MTTNTTDSGRRRRAYAVLFCYAVMAAASITAAWLAGGPVSGLLLALAVAAWATADLLTDSRNQHQPVKGNTVTLTTRALPAPIDRPDLDPLTLTADQLALYRAGLRAGLASTTHGRSGLRSYALALLSSAELDPVPDVTPDLPELAPNGLTVTTPAPPADMPESRWLAWEYAHAAPDDALAQALTTVDPIANEWLLLPQLDDVTAGLDTRRHVALATYLAHQADALRPAIERRQVARQYALADATDVAVAARMELADSAGAWAHLSRLAIVAERLVQRDAMGGVRGHYLAWDVPANQLDYLADLAGSRWCSVAR